MARGFAVLLLAVGAAAAARGQEVPLADLTPKQVADRLQQAFTDPNYKGAVENRLKAAGVPGLKVDPRAVGFVGPDGKAAAKFVPGETKLVWRYTADAPLDAAQRQKADTAMRQTLSEVLLQYRGPKGDQSGLLKDADWQVLSNGLVFEPAAPATTANARPTITPVPDVRVVAGAVPRVRFTVADAETRPADLRVTSASSNPTVLPPAHQIITLVPGQDGVRELEMITTQGQTGTVRVTLTVTDAGGLTASTGFTLTVVAADGSPGGAPGEIPVIQSRPEPPAGGTGGGFGSSTPGGAGGYGAAGGAWYGAGTGYPAAAYPYAPFYPAAPCYPTAVVAGFGGGSCGRCCGRGWSAPPACVVVPVVPCPAPVYPPAPACYPAAAAQSSAVAVAPVAARAEAAPVSRTELVKGKRAGDAAGLYGAGYAAFWAGKYAEAAEYCAAAAELSDDPRAWYYLGFARASLGDADGARAAIRYAAAVVRAEPGRERDVNEALGRMQGPDRARLIALQEEVRSEGGTRAALAARPDLRQPARPAPDLTATRPAQR